MLLQKPISKICGIRVSYRILHLVGDTFFRIVNVCEIDICKSCCLGPKMFAKIAALRLNLVGFGS